MQLHLQTFSFDALELYQKDSLNNLVLKYEFTEKIDRNIEIPLQIKPLETAVFYAKVHFVKSIYFPAQLISESNSVQLKNSSVLKRAVFYAFVLVVLLMNLMFYYNTKDVLYGYYSLWVISLSLLLLELDGVFYDVFGNTKFIFDINLLLRVLTALTIMLFVTKALNLKKEFPKFNTIGFSILFVNILANLLYVFTYNLLWYSVGEVCSSALFVMYCCVSFSLWNKLQYARIIAIAYSILFISSVLYVLPAEFGLVDIGFSNSYLKIGSAIEMLVFLYAISYRYKILEHEKEQIENEFEVQVAFQKAKEVVAIKNVQQTLNDFHLTPREIQIAKMILEGKTNKIIAGKLQIKRPTVKFHVSNILVKLDITNRTELFSKVSKS